MEKGALNGLVVTDFTAFAAGPLATKFLADHGAEVIKIESNARPDVVRAFMPFADGTPGVNRSISFAEGNTSKYSFSLNLSHPQGSDVARRLISCCDAVVENFNPGVMEKLGLAYSDLVKTRPDIIMVSMSGLGQTGPHSRHRNIGLTTQALGGINHFIGWPDRAPVGYSIPYPDAIIPWFALLALMAAVDYRNSTGAGQHIDATMLETTLNFMAPALLDYTVNRREGTRVGNRSPYAAPHGVYRCRGDDRWCAIEVFDDDWPGFCNAMGNPEWSGDPRFSTLQGRKENEEELNGFVEEWTAKRSAEDVMDLMQRAGVGAGIVQNSEDIADKDAHFIQRQFYQVVSGHPEIGSYESPSASFKLSKTPGRPRAAPCLGEHTEYVCTEIMGISDREFAELLATGVLQ
jgi:benzylsuccinate CoA-transferase BbsF subunit